MSLRDQPHRAVGSATLLQRPEPAELLGSLSCWVAASDGLGWVGLDVLANSALIRASVGSDALELVVRDELVPTFAGHLQASASQARALQRLHARRSDTHESPPTAPRITPATDLESGFLGVVVETERARAEEDHAAVDLGPDACDAVARTLLEALGERVAERSFALKAVE